MTRKSVQVLAAVVVGLLLLLVVVQRGDRFESLPADRLLLPGFGEQANEVRRIDVRYPNDEGSVTIQRDDDRWGVGARGGYPADFSKLSRLMIELAEATIVDEMTANPDRYAAIGVDDPLDGGSGTRVKVSGDDFAYIVILGNEARRDLRYVRLTDGPASYLVDRELSIPDVVTDWLKPAIIDIPATRVRSVTISHGDGERIVIEKESEGAANFTVLDVPEGRELSYDTIGNSIGGALAGLELADVRSSVDAGAATTVDFETWDGLGVTVAIVSEDDVAWLSVSATAAAGGVDGPETGDLQSEAESINQRLSGWQFRIADFKKNTLTRRWDDILKAS